MNTILRRIANNSPHTPQILKIFSAISMIAVVSIWSFPNVIAIRYILSGLALIVLASTQSIKIPNITPIYFLFIFCIYLCFTPLFPNNDPFETILNIKREWAYFAIFSVIGIGIANSGISQKSSTIGFIVALAFINAYHLAQFLVNKSPLGFSGIAGNHGPLSYSSFQAMTLLMPLLFFGALKTWEKILLLLIAAILLSSIVIASSRGGIVFYFLVICVTLLIYTYLKRSNFNQIKLLSFVLITSLAIFMAMKVSHHKWQNFSEIASIGWRLDATNINCSGVEIVKNDLINQQIPISKATEYAINDLNLGTAARITAAISAVELAIENPLGLNASKEAYKQLLTRKCPTAKIVLANSHNGWLDTSLAIGIPGATIFLSIFLLSGLYGVGCLKKINPEYLYVPITLIIISVGWVFRGVLDATSRDHMLQMQAFFIFYYLTLTHNIITKK